MCIQLVSFGYLRHKITGGQTRPQLLVIYHLVVAL